MIFRLLLVIGIALAQFGYYLGFSNKAVFFDDKRDILKSTLPAVAVLLINLLIAIGSYIADTDLFKYIQSDSRYEIIY